MSQEISKNRKAYHDFNIVDKFEAGIELRGTEVKSIRDGHVHLRDAFAIVQNNHCLLYTSPSPRDGLLSRMPSSA